MPNLLEFLNMRVFINPIEARHERPHVHVAKFRRPKSESIKIWIDDLTVAKAHKSFKQLEVAKALVFIARNKDFCMDAWVKQHGKTKGR